MFNFKFLENKSLILKKKNSIILFHYPYHFYYTIYIFNIFSVLKNEKRDFMVRAPLSLQMGLLQSNSKIC